ncbi:uncharacterized protein BYT42DRAFT_611743 [Radiomyces spectabilis]|uniref:uncharacterized protein n=1 Tax=Radiomyces spectabilis TaxID=64574 RepID=UPI0022208BF0|nr:uncharacterized protein BYT42DRAFT_611743 [Radiomyces spectabilis]KAI8388737.1 hypothetical protein BYT42DRAFT_611743 [Radiomyces spectabilis]
MATIHAIDKHSVHKICSGQVILDLATAVKEFIENSLDAGATCVDVKFKDYGLESVEVLDNGSGIDPSNYEFLALKHYTSKLENFEDLEKVATFGFRGEALSSLCALSDLVITTATKEQAPKGVRLIYDSDGQLVSTTPVARSVGTSVQITKMFHSLPVRQREFKRTIRREYGKALSMIQAYGIISRNTRITATNQVAKGSPVRALSTNGNDNLKDNIANIFGSKFSTQVIPFSLCLEDVLGRNDDQTIPRIEGYISKPQWGLGRSAADRQYFYINGRPCSLPKIAKAFNELYRNFISNQYPFIVADLHLQPDMYDVNVSPDKRTIFLHSDQLIAQHIIEALTEQLEPYRSTYEVNPFEKLKKRSLSADLVNHAQVDDLHASHDLPPALQQRDSPQNATCDRSTSIPRSPSLPSSIQHLESLAFAPAIRRYTSTTSSNSSPSRGKRHSNTLLNYVTKRPKASEDDEIQYSAPALYSENAVSELSLTALALRSNESNETTLNTSALMAQSQQVETEAQQGEDMDVDSEVTGLEKDTEMENAEDTTEIPTPNHADLTSEIPMRDTLDNETYFEEAPLTLSFRNLWNSTGEHATAHVNYRSVNLSSERYRPIFCDANDAEDAFGDNGVEEANITNTVDLEKAYDALRRVIDKSDFKNMQILGQFNLGFIITLLNGKDLFIIDQHASDEKYNFETLQSTTQIKGQRLIRPQRLELTASEELVVIENANILRANGFEIEINEDNESSKRVQVLSQPTSKNTMFDKRDFGELICLLSEHPGQMVRCSRVRAMFASRACRKSVMIGDPLNKRQMIQIVRHMSEIDQPWNCPHGRPTMRHLFTLRSIDILHNSSRKFTYRGSIFSSKS